MAEPDRPTLVSVGHKQRSVDELVGLLVENCVDVLVNVRLNALSRKRA